MKILHIIPSYLPAHRALGPINPTHFLNAQLVKKGVDITVYTTNLDECEIMDVPIGVPVFIDGVRVYYFPVSFPRKWYYSGALRKTLKQGVPHFDLVHITSVFLAASTLGAHYAKKFKKPYIISPHGSLMKEPLAMKSPIKKKIYLDLFEKRNLAGAAAVHFTVDIEREEYLGAGLPLKKSFVIPNGFDPKEFEKKPPYGFFRKKFNISNDKKLVLSLGRINWKKGFDTLIPAFKTVVANELGIILIIAGGDDYGYKKQIDKWVSENGLKGNVIFTGALTGDDKIAAFQDSQAFVLPSYSENFGMAVVEAMYLNLPVIITKGVGIASCVDNAGAGLVIEKNEEDLSAAILKILGNRTLAEKFGRQGRHLVETEFAASAVADEFSKIYNELTKNGQ